MSNHNQQQNNEQATPVCTGNCNIIGFLDEYCKTCGMVISEVPVDTTESMYNQ